MGGEAERQRSLRVLVAGGAGFIGSHLCDRLLADGHDVVCLDNLSTGRQSNSAEALGHPRFSFVRADLVDGVPATVAEVHQVYHLASPASPPGYQKYPIETLRVNSEGTRHLLELAARSSASFLYASTSEAYGDPLEHPQRESYRGNVSSTGPRSMYDEAKRYGEALTMAYCRTRGVSARIVRIFNTYGPRSDPGDGRLVPNFIAQALRGEPLTVYGHGQQTRSLCYVSDLVEGLVRAMASSATVGEVTNLGNPEERTVLEYAAIISRLAGGTGGLVFCDPAVGDDPQRRQPDITLARERLGWMPTVDLEAGLRRTIADFGEALQVRQPGTMKAARPLV